MEVKTVIFQVLLIAATLVIAWRVLASVGQRTQALRRLGLLLFAALAVMSILFPETWTVAANAIGIGRGTDLIVYMLVVAFFSFVATTFRRFRDYDVRYTRLARRLAIDEASPAVAERRRMSGSPQDPTTGREASSE